MLNQSLYFSISGSRIFGSYHSTLGLPTPSSAIFLNSSLPIQYKEAQALAENWHTKAACRLALYKTTTHATWSPLQSTDTTLCPKKVPCKLYSTVVVPFLDLIHPTESSNCQYMLFGMPMRHITQETTYLFGGNI